MNLITGDGYFDYEDHPELVTFGDFGITRGIKNQTVKIFPVRFDPVKRKIKLYKRIVFRVNFSKGGTFSQQPAR